MSIMSSTRTVNKAKSKVIAGLSNAEKVMKSVISEASRVGLYDIAGAASRIAGEIFKLANEAGDTGPHYGAARGDDRVPLVVPASIDTTARRLHASTYGGRSEAAQTQFRIIGDVLVRSGPSKTGAGSYVHKVARSVFERIVDTMAALAGETPNAISVEAIVARLRRDGFEQPTYQVYATITFLRHRRSIVQDGRDGYLVNPTIGEVARSAWKELSADHPLRQSEPQSGVSANAQQRGS
jgi:L-serine deaminase